MNDSNALLSQVVAFRTYARYLPHLQRRESLEETINRNMIMHLERFPALSKEIIRAYGLVHDRKVMPSMRAFQFAGPAIAKNNARLYNCSFLHVSDQRAFPEILFLLLAGTGVGYSIQSHHVNQLPKVGYPREEGVFKVQDSIHGWADAVDALTRAYFYNAVRPIFDLTGIRPKGARLVTSGAKAPGPEPLKHMLELLEARFKEARGRRLRPIEVHDIACIISDCVIAGGVRRSAMISLFDRTDTEMLKAKSGEWWVQHPYRGRANNSVVLPRKEVTREEFDAIFKACEKSGAGEPGFFWTNNPEVGTNPCAEISLNSHQFCNLTTINQTGIEDKADFLRRVNAATFIGTLQATYTDFPYLRPQWQTVTEKEALLGVSFTGIADSGSQVTAEWLEEGAVLAKEINERYAKKLGINPSARITTVKPEGTSSTVLGSSSGVHARHALYYLRRIRMNKNDNLAHYLTQTIPDLVEDDVSAANTIVVTIPQESPQGAVLREQETALQMLERVMRYNTHWIRPGHRTGDNHHNVSCTVSMKDEDWGPVGEYLWKHRAGYTGISLLPYDGGTYKQAPFETCDQATYEKYGKLVKAIDLKEVRETDDESSLAETVACGGGACELVSV